MTAAVIVTRPPEAGAALVDGLAAEGLRVHAVPTVRLAALPTSPLEAAAGTLVTGDWVVVTSPSAARPIGRTLVRRAARGIRWAAVGESTADALAGSGIAVNAVPDRPRPDAVVAAMCEHGCLEGRRVLVPRSDAADGALLAALAAAGAQVASLVAYRTIEGPPESVPALGAAIGDPDLRAAVVASGSAARGLAALLGTLPAESEPAANGRPAPSVPIVSIGPATTRAARAAGLTVAAQATRPSVEPVVDAVLAVVAAEAAAPPLFARGGPCR